SSPISPCSRPRSGSPRATGRRERPRQDQRLVAGVEPDTRAEHPVRPRLDLVERAAAAVPEERQLDGERARRQREQRPGALEVGPGARDLVAEERRQRGYLPLRRQVVLGDAEVAEVLARDVDPVALEVAPRVLPEARQGQRGRELVAV